MLNITCLGRLLLACVCGIAIGWERKNRSKEAGVRTHCVVAVASALMMIVSKYAYFDLIQAGIFEGADVRLDPSRVASTVVTGIGFLGAGMIFINKNSIVGLTTAAGIWATSGIGLALGGGLIFIGISMTVILLAVQYLLHFDVFSMHSAKVKNLHIYNIPPEKSTDYLDGLTMRLKEQDIIITAIGFEKSAQNGITDYNITLEVPHLMREDKIAELIEYDCTLSE